jgi:hypothetical protein
VLRLPYLVDRVVKQDGDLPFFRRLPHMKLATVKMDVISHRLDIHADRAELGGQLLAFVLGMSGLIRSVWTDQAFHAQYGPALMVGQAASQGRDDG